ncbi:hypothetical protein EJ06DRAFT_24184 [Trichodelitschia bisporula]|uniref:Uncharacterized protein n=1 Tax=Trichodelitschia bisporula TaxID=703511 RepID=A0A6G1IBI2_9PEZI|nr:hypothetical protein EJ06DRAFT_24184 [Trichodelitschia bisporula]
MALSSCLRCSDRCLACLRLPTLASILPGRSSIAPKLDCRAHASSVPYLHSFFSQHSAIGLPGFGFGLLRRIYTQFAPTLCRSRRADGARSSGFFTFLFPFMLLFFGTIYYDADFTADV